MNSKICAKDQSSDESNEGDAQRAHEKAKVSRKHVDHPLHCYLQENDHSTLRICRRRASRIASRFSAAAAFWAESFVLLELPISFAERRLNCFALRKKSLAEL